MQTDATIPTMLEECAKVSNIVALRSCYHGTKVGSCWLESLSDFKLCATTPNNMQQQKTCNRVCKQSQHVTSIVWSCWPTMSGPFARSLIKAPAKRVRAFLKPHIFYPYPCGRALKTLLRALSKRRSFGERIHWFSCGRKAFLVLHFKPDSGSIKYKLTFSKWET